MTQPVRRLTLADVPMEALLTRPRIALDTAPLVRLLAGRRVLVTGAGGSIGSELCRQIAAAGPAHLAMVDRYENGLHAIATEIEGTAALQPYIGDVTDTTRLSAIFADAAPELVFHAAAHKHVPLMESAPAEAVKNNVTGTRLVAEAAARHGTRTFVLISTDKACRPSSVMGATKRVAELVVRDMAPRAAGTHFVTVRFGNVLGSNGSVVPRFLDQINAGGPITITHPDVRRFFMLIPEAAQLVLHAAAMPDHPALCVLDLGEQTRIETLARTLTQAVAPGATIPLVFIGLRAGEKVSEELIGADESVDPSSVPPILKLCVRDGDTRGDFAGRLRALESAAAGTSAGAVITALTRVVPSFTPARALVETALAAMAGA